MFARLTIFKKGLVIISVPLLFQFILIWLAGALQSRSAEAASLARHSQLVSGQAQIVLRHLLDSETGARGHVLTGHAAFTESCDLANTETPRALAELQSLVEENPDQLAQARQIAARAASLLTQHQEIRRLVEQGQRAQAKAQIGVSKTQMDVIRQAIQQFTSEEQQRTGDREQHLARVQWWLKAALAGGFCFSLLFTMGLALLFHRNVARRLDALIENTRHLRRGTSLAIPLTGADEIAQVDQAFHEAAQELACTLEDLREVTARMNLALASAHVGTWSWDLYQDAVFWDEFMPPLFGLKAGTFGGRQQDVVRLIHADERDRVQQKLVRAIKTATDYHDEFRVVWPDGSEHVLAMRGEVHRTPSGSSGKLTGVCWDITERKQAEATIYQLNQELECRVLERTAELAEANRELYQKNQEIEMFVYSVSHDLRSPLVNLQGFSQELNQVARELRTLLGQPELPDKVRTRGTALIDRDMAECIRFIQTAVLRLGNIIDALLRLSRAGRVVYQLQKVDMQALVQRVVDSHKITMTERNATILMHKDLPPAWGDRTALEAVFANLIGNALNYLDPKRPGVIEVGCLANVAEVQTEMQRTYYVKDNGLGIADAHKPKVFQAFQRLHPQVAPGEGMGLTIVQRIVGRHRGKVALESKAGVGSTFFVTLPVRDESEGQGASKTTASFHAPHPASLVSPRRPAGHES